VEQPANFTLLHESGAGFSYRLDIPHQITIGGYIYQDQALSWRGEGVAHCFIKITAQELVIEAEGAGLLSVDPWDLIPTWQRARKADLYRVFDGGQRTRQQTFEVGHSVVFDVRPGGQYVIAMGDETPVSPPPDGGLEVNPKPGEHVLLLGDFENYVESSLQYIRRFAPDFTFAVDEVAGRWAYVSVVAPPDLIPDEVLADIRGVGTVVVERVVGKTPQETKTILDELARRGQRFLTAISPIPPQEEPPTDAGTDGSGLEPEIYVVQSGDTLGKIAKTLYGDSRLWTPIFEANRDKISDPSMIRVGMVLNIPPKSS
jgi:LysM repeat protein